MSQSKPGAIALHERVEFTFDSQLRRCFTLDGGAPEPCTSLRYTRECAILTGAEHAGARVDARACAVWSYTRIPRRAAL